MQIKTFNDFLQAANAQPEPQRLLFVLAQAGLPDDPSDEERLAYEQGEGGVLSPVLCVDKLPEELPRFEQLLEESTQTGVHWDLAFASALSGRAGIAPTSDEALQPLQMMAEQVKAGLITRFLVINRDGDLLQIS